MTKIAALLVLLVSTSASAKGPTSRQRLHGERAQLTALGYYGEEAADEAGKTAGNCPGAADGRELIGTAAKEWTLTDWANSAPLSLQKLRGRVVVVRFWTVGCPFCEKSMPALERLATEFRDQPVTIIGAFHAKPADSASNMSEPLKVAKGWGITFPLAFDRQWRTLRSWFLDGHHRHATSATFVIGKDGTIVHVHPGPVFYPTDVPADAEKNHDFLAVREAIVKALAGGQSDAELRPQVRFFLGEVEQDIAADVRHQMELNLASDLARSFKLPLRAFPSREAEQDFFRRLVRAGIRPEDLGGEIVKLSREAIAGLTRLLETRDESLLEFLKELLSGESPDAFLKALAMLDEASERVRKLDLGSSE